MLKTFSYLSALALIGLGSTTATATTLYPSLMNDGVAIYADDLKYGDSFKFYYEGGKDVTFEFGAMKMPFTAEGFLLSFSLPNFYFHASTAYDILRANGVPLGKRYFLGAMKMKG